MKAVVMGRNYTSRLGMIRAAGQAGCEVIVVATVSQLPFSFKARLLRKDKMPDCCSKYVIRYLYAKEPDREALVELLLRECAQENEKTVLLPTDDFVASTVDLYQERLREKFLFPHIDHEPGAVVRLMDKDVQKKLARETGLPVADGWVVDIRDGKYQIPEEVSYPCFPKPEISVLGNKRCMKRCDSEAELRAVADIVAAESDCPLLVEEYIDFQKEYGILGFCDRGKAIIPGIVDKLEIGNGNHKGVTMVGRYQPLDRFGDLKEKLERFMAKTGFTGLFDIDLYELDGVVYFNELNLRLGAFGFAAVCAGINLPALLIETLTGSDLTSVPEDMQKEIACVSEKVALDDYANGYLTWAEYLDKIMSADYGFIRSTDDPGPYRVFCRKVRVARLRQRLKKLMERN